MRKSQSSIEYMMILGFALIAIMILFIISIFYSGQANDQLLINQVDQIAKKIRDSSESIYYLGQPSKTTIKVYMPDKIKQINIAQKELVFTVTTQKGETNIVYLSRVNLSGSIPTTPGIKYLTIESKGDYVLIST